MSKNELALIKPQPPTTVAPRSYGDFDQWCAIADIFYAWQTKREELEERLAKPGQYKPIIELYEWHADKFNDREIDTMVAEWHAGEDWYNRAELYDGHKLKREVVSEQVALLIGSFPNAGPHNGEVYTRMLIEEIFNEEPNACCLESACRRVRRTMTFPPSIAQFLKVLREESDRWCDRWCVMEGGPEKLGKYLRADRDGFKAAIAKAKEKLATDK